MRGRSYDQRDGSVNPAGLPNGGRLARYSRLFPVLELDSTYDVDALAAMLPGCRSWAASEGLRFAVEFRHPSWLASGGPLASSAPMAERPLDHVCRWQKTV